MKVYIFCAPASLQMRRCSAYFYEEACISK
jgi:hypothetical protein